MDDATNDTIAFGIDDVECGGVVVEGCKGSLHAVHQPQRLDMW